MTAIAYKDGVLAGDSGAFSGYRPASLATKVIKSPAGWLAGASGDTGKCEAFLRWVNGGMAEAAPSWPVKDGDGFEGLAVAPNGEVWLYDINGDHALQLADFHAIGCCHEMLAGAMAAGADPEQAVEIAIKHHVYAAGPVTVVKLEPVDEDVEEAALDIADEPKPETLKQHLGLV